MSNTRIYSVGGSVALAALALATSPLRAQVNPVTFIPSTGGPPISISYAGNKFVGSNYFDGQLYQTDLLGGNLQTFGAPFFTSGDPGNGEHFVASSLGLGGFGSRDVFVARSNDIVMYNNAGTTMSTFATGFSGVIRGILFDAVGSFGNQMLVTTSAGDVYKVDSAGNKSLIANVGEDAEGLDIAPTGAGFGTFDGQLIVASEGTGSIRAISTGGTVTYLTSVASAEELTFVPLDLGASGDPVEGFYGANYAQNVLKAPTSDFTGMLGDAIVTGETTHVINRVHWNGSSFVVSNVGNFPNQPEDGIFVTRAIINSTVPEPGTLAMLAGLGVAGSMFGLRRRTRTRAAK